MNRFVKLTLNDIRGGRETWRVLLTLCAPSFLVAVCIALARTGF